jgi:hypothetical protein
MSLSVQGRKMLWGRSGNRCSYTDCSIELAQEHDATANAVVIGEEAHIVAQSVRGPRGKSPLSPEQRDAYSNLVLLCPTHHNLVDSDEDAFPVARLLTMKKAHEAHVRTSLDASKLQNDEQWARIVDGFTGWLEMDNWDDNFTGIFVGGEARLKTRKRVVT